MIDFGTIQWKAEGSQRISKTTNPKYFFTLPYKVWSSIVIVHEKSGFLLLFFRNISKTAETILIKKIGRNHGISIYKKALCEHGKNYIFQDNNCFVKMSVS